MPVVTIHEGHNPIIRPQDSGKKSSSSQNMAGLINSWSKPIKAIDSPGKGFSMKRELPIAVIPTHYLILLAHFSCAFLKISRPQVA